MKIIHDMKEADYHALKAMSASQLKQANESWANWRWFHDHPPSSDKAHFKIGSAIHMMIMEPERADKEIIIVDIKGVQKNWKANDYEKKPLLANILKDFERKNPGMLVIRTEHYDEADEIVNRVKKRPDIMGLFKGGYAEAVIKGQIEGYDVKAMVDYFKDHGDDSVTVFDIKTIAKTHKALQYHFEDYGYHIQEAWYRRMLKAAGKEVRDFYFILIYKTPPYEIGIVQISPDLRLFGEVIVERLWEEYKECIKTWEWPGEFKPMEITEIEAPYRLLKELNIEGIKSTLAEIDGLPTDYIGQ
jgi:hypothetical protein